MVFILRHFQNKTDDVRKVSGLQLFSHSDRVLLSSLFHGKLCIGVIGNETLIVLIGNVIGCKRRGSLITQSGTLVMRSPYPVNSHTILGETLENFVSLLMENHVHATYSLDCISMMHDDCKYIT